MNQTHKERLLKLAAHLRKGKLGHDVFDFSVINRNRTDLGKPIGSVCGTNGCAMGELPIVFPKYFRFGDSGVVARAPYYKKVPFYEAVEDFFDLREYEVDGLFIPYCRRDWLPGVPFLRSDATKEEVAQNIENYIAWVEAGRP